MYKNYGDKDFFEFGILAKECDEYVNVLYCSPDPDKEGKYIFANCYVDPDADWVDKSVLSCDTDADRVIRAIACVEYYGVCEFTSGAGYELLSREEVEDRLKMLGIDPSNIASM